MNINLISVLAIISAGKNAQGFALAEKIINSGIKTEINAKLTVF